MDRQQQQQMNEAAEQFTNTLVAAYKTTSGHTAAAQELGAQLTEYFFNSVINNLRTQTGGAQQVTWQLINQQQRAKELAQASTDTYMEVLDSIFSFYQGGTSRRKKRIEEAQRRAEEAQRQAQEAGSRRSEAESRAEEAQRRAEEAENSRSEAERRAEEAESRAEEAERRTEEAESSRSEAQRQAEESESSTREAESSRSEAIRRAEEAESRAQEAERRAEEAQRRAEEVEGGRSEVESQGDENLPLADYDSLNVGEISERLNELSVEETRRLRDYETQNKNRSTLVRRLNSRIEAAS
ncbi:MAG: hypothetical protein JO266_05000 [Acidobacteria bacterium]|nr:hypothetical protein [Acidobacteriota bacterium]